MTVLGIDTASSFCAVSAVSDGRVVAARTSVRRRAHAEELMTMIDECMDAAGQGTTRPDVVAVSGGPGSFTGLRIGFSAAKGICSAAGSALVVVPTFEAWASAAAGKPAPSGTSRILTVMSAGRGEVFVAGFERTGGGVTALSGPSLVPAGKLAGIAAGERAAIVVGESREELEVWFDTSGDVRYVGLADDGIDVAGSVALLGLGAFTSGAIAELAAASPEYGRDFLTTVQNKRKGVI